MWFERHLDLQVNLDVRRKVSNSDDAKDLLEDELDEIVLIVFVCFFFDFFFSWDEPSWTTSSASLLQKAFRVLYLSTSHWSQSFNTSNSLFCVNNEI